MVIYGVTFLGACYIIGQLIGDYLAKLLGVQANVGGVGFARRRDEVIDTPPIAQAFRQPALIPLTELLPQLRGGCWCRRQREIRHRQVLW